jgi:hypothetical protein
VRPPGLLRDVRQVEAFSGKTILLRQVPQSFSASLGSRKALAKHLPDLSAGAGP